LGAVQKAFGKATLTTECEIVSSDLTTASDLIPHEIAAALSAGLCFGSNAPQWIEEALEVLVGPMTLNYVPPDTHHQRSS
jgi:hypothetical protein